jgi:hypothetical protein
VLHPGVEQPQQLLARVRGDEDHLGTGVTEAEDPERGLLAAIHDDTTAVAHREVDREPETCGHEPAFPSRR